MDDILEFFSASMEPPDTDLLRTMSTLGYQIGSFIARKGSSGARDITSSMRS